MEAFEAFVAVTLEAEGVIVSEAVKFPVTRQTTRSDRVEMQTHGFEVDLVAARADKLILATVKSFFGSTGVIADDVIGDTETRGRRLYALLNDPVVRSAVVSAACDRYGFATSQVELRLYVGKFAGAKHGIHETRIRAWCADQIVGGGPIRAFGVDEIAALARSVAGYKMYRDNQALVAIKVLEAAHMLKASSEPS